MLRGTTGAIATPASSRGQYAKEELSLYFVDTFSAVRIGEYAIVFRFGLR